MKPSNRLKNDDQTYFAGQWAGAGVYRCLDPCPLGQREVVLAEDGFLPDPTGGWVGRFVRVNNQRVRKREADFTGEEMFPDEKGQAEAEVVYEGLLPVRK